MADPGMGYDAGWPRRVSRASARLRQVRGRQMRVRPSLREPVNAVTHSIGAILSVIGLVVLLIVAVRNESARQVVAYSIFGGSLVAMYTVSAFYHSFNLTDRGLAHVRRIDHMMIYVLI